MPKILVSGAVRGDLARLFAAVAKAEARSGPFAACFCVGDFLDAAPGHAERLDALDAATVPVYFVTGHEAVDADLAARLAAKNARWLGRSGCEDVAGLRVGFLGGAHDPARYDEAAPDDGADAAAYAQDDVEALLIAAGAYRTDGGCDVLLTHDVPADCGAGLSEDDPRRAECAGASAPLGAAMRDLKASYHFVASKGDGWSLEPYRCGVGGYLRLARLHALPEAGRKRSLRAFSVEPFSAAADDIDTEEGARAASLRAKALREATANPYVLAEARKLHKPPPGLLKRKPMAAAALEEEEAAASAPAPAPAPEQPAAAEPTPSEFASFPASFGGRGQKAKHEVQEVAGPPRPVYSAPNKPEGFDDPWQPKEKKQKRVSIYANQNGGIANPKKGKRKRMGAPHGPQF